MIRSCRNSPMTRSLSCGVSGLEGLESRLAKHPPAVPREEYDERLEYELGHYRADGVPRLLS